MKMKFFICAILIFSFTSGANAPSQPVDSTKVNLDSIFIEQAAKRYMDSVARKEFREIDSLATVIDSLKQEAFKKKVIGRVDIWGPYTKRDTLKWWYWQYPNGERRFIGTTKN